MKTALDQHQELILQSLHEEDSLVCTLLPLKAGTRNEKVPETAGWQYEVHFHGVSDYIVLQELTHAALGLDFADECHLTECLSGEIAKMLKIQEDILDGDSKHFVLRTAHCAVHVFTSDLPDVIETSRAH